MCGIAGVFRSSNEVPLAPVPTALRDALRHRGPDKFGIWSDEWIQLLHWRLAVIDLSEFGWQPMKSRNGNIVMVYNGEIYNTLELRSLVEEEFNIVAGRKIHWRGRSDSEVLVEAFSLFGMQILERVNGMFAAAFWLKDRRELVLVRDRMGIKPLFFWHDDQRVVFASEQKVFRLLDGFRPGLAPDGLLYFLRYGNRNEAKGVLSGVEKIKPGVACTFKVGENGRLERCFDHRFRRKAVLVSKRWSVEGASMALRDCLKDSVSRQLVADVPVGVFLSGGIDSSILCLLAAQTLGAKHTKAFTLGYVGQGSEYDESDCAKRTAEFLKIDHYLLIPETDDLIEQIQRMVSTYDEPFGDAAALNMMSLSRMVAQHVTVALAGEGADELFGGYRRYRTHALLVNNPRLRRVVRFALAGLPPGVWRELGRRFEILFRSMRAISEAEMYSAYFEPTVGVESLVGRTCHLQVPVERKISGADVRMHKDSLISALCLRDQVFWLVDTYLEKSDKGSMASSLEVRVPFLDDRVVDFANSLPDNLRVRRGIGKWLLRKAFEKELPRHLLKRRKRGFGVPIAKWFRNELSEYFRSNVLTGDSRICGIVDANVIGWIFEQHVAGASDHSLILWRVLLLEVWLRQWNVTRGQVEEAFL